jgi:hypothetical protein
MSIEVNIEAIYNNFFVDAAQNFLHRVLADIANKKIRRKKVSEWVSKLFIFFF